MKTGILFALAFACLVAFASAAGGGYSSCSWCTYPQKCYTCPKSNNVWCTDLWSGSQTCCSATSFSVVYCTGENCCSKTTKIIIGVAVAGAIVALLVGAFLIFWCIRTRRNRVHNGGFPQGPHEVVEVHHHAHHSHQQAYGATTAQVGYQAPVYGASAQVGYQASYH